MPLLRGADAVEGLAAGGQVLADKVDGGGSGATLQANVGAVPVKKSRQLHCAAGGQARVLDQIAEPKIIKNNNKLKKAKEKAGASERKEKKRKNEQKSKHE